jgi:hypothetical protein
MVYGLYEIFRSNPEGTSLSIPAKILTKVVFPVPFSPNSTMIWDSENDPASISS